MNSFQFFANTTLFNDKRQNHYKEPWVSWTQGKGVDYNKSREEKLYGQYFTLKAVQDSSFKIGMLGIFAEGESMYYSLDEGKSWVKINSDTFTPLVQAGKNIMWKGEQIPSNNGIGMFKSTGKYTVEGNIMSLLYGDNFTNQTSLQNMSYAFGMLFVFESNLLSAEDLIMPATTLAEGCYMSMFSNCTSLEKTPKILPALTLANSCYSNMFTACSNILSTPELPALTLVESCYNNMFSYCSKLNFVKCLATDISASRCVQGFLSGISSTGTFVKNPSTPASTWSNELPSGWTIVDATE